MSLVISAVYRRPVYCGLFWLIVAMLVGVSVGAGAPVPTSSLDKALAVLGGDDVTIAAGLETTANGDAVSMAIADNGDIYVALVYYTGPWYDQYTILSVYRSQDGGQSWNLWGSVDGSVDNEVYRDPSLVVAEGIVSRCYLAYVSTMPGLSGRQVRLVQADLTAASISFAAPKIWLSETGRWARGLELATDVDSFNDFYLYVTFATASTASLFGGEIWVGRSTDQGATLNAPYIVATPPGSSSYYQTPHIAHGFGDYVHLAWTIRSLSGAHDAALRYTRAPNAAGAGLAGWEAVQELTSTSDGFNEGAGGIAPTPFDNTVVINYQRANLSGLVDEGGVFVSSDQGVTFVKQIANTLGFRPRVRRNPGSNEWYIGESQIGPAFQNSAAGDLTVWSDRGGFSQEVSTSYNSAETMDFAFDPSHGNRLAAVWVVADSVGLPVRLDFDAEWRSDPGYPTTEPGFPVALTAAPRSAPAVVDIDGDGDLEIVFADVANRIQVFDHDGTVHPGWPVTVPTGLSTAPVAVGDLNGDGRPSLVVGTTAGLVYAYEPTGTAGDFWTYDTQSGQPAYPSIGHLAPPHGQVVAVASGQVVLFLTGAGNRAYGSAQGLFAAPLDHPPVFGDVDNDGVPEVVVSAGPRLWKWNLAGIGFDVTISGGPDITGTVSLGDLDLDGDQEIVVPTATGQLYVLQGDGSIEPGWPVSVGSSAALTSAAIGQLLGNSVPEIAVASRNWTVDVRFADGSEGAGWPAPVGSSWFLFGMPVIGMVEGASPDVVIGSRDSSGWAWDNFGNVLAGWPKPVGDVINVAAALGDLDLDGSQEVVLISNSQLWVGDVHQAPGLATNWPMAGHDPQRSGCADCQFDLVSAVGGGDGPGSRVSFAAPLPNPSHGNNVFSFTIPQQAVVTLDVFDVRGRRVRRIERSELAAGPHVVAWNGHDDQGRPVGSGTYVAGLTVRGPGVNAHVQRKLTLLR